MIEWYEYLEVNQKLVFRLYFLLMKILGAINLPDWRILDLKNDQYTTTYKTFNMILDRLQTVTQRKSSGSLITLLNR
jgi:hypothetical protein